MGRPLDGDDSPKVVFVGSIPTLPAMQCLCTLHKYSGVAHLVEQLPCNEQVGGSSPLSGSMRSDTQLGWTN